MTMPPILPPHLTQDEIASICHPLRQHAAQIRYLRSLGLLVHRRPDGSPLVSRTEWDTRLTTRPQHTTTATHPRWQNT